MTRSSTRRSGRRARRERELRRCRSANRGPKRARRWARARSGGGGDRGRSRCGRGGARRGSARASAAVVGGSRRRGAGGGATPALRSACRSHDDEHPRPRRGATAGASGTLMAHAPSVNQEPSSAHRAEEERQRARRRARAPGRSGARPHLDARRRGCQGGSGRAVSTNTTDRPEPRSVAVTVSASTRPVPHVVVQPLPVDPPLDEARERLRVHEVGEPPGASWREAGRAERVETRRAGSAARPQRARSGTPPRAAASATRRRAPRPARDGSSGERRRGSRRSPRRWTSRRGDRCAAARRGRSASGSSRRQRIDARLVGATRAAAAEDERGAADHGSGTSSRWRGTCAGQPSRSMRASAAASAAGSPCTRNVGAGGAGNVASQRVDLVLVGVRGEAADRRDARAHRRRPRRGCAGSRRRPGAPARACPPPGSRRAARSCAGRGGAGARWWRTRPPVAMPDAERMTHAPVRRRSSPSTASASGRSVTFAGRSGSSPAAKRRVISSSWSSRCASEDRRRVERHGRVDEDGQGGDRAPRPRAAQREEHLLRPADREGGDDERPARADRALDLGRERLLGRAVGVPLPAVRALDDERVGGAAGLGVGQDRHAVPAEIAAEEEARRLVRPASVELDECAEPRMCPARRKRSATPGAISRRSP